MIKNKHFLLIGGSFVAAIMAHTVFIYEMINGTYMVGPNDGLAQMVPFRKMLYEQFKNGDFFYSFQYGLGGGTYQLSFYYYNSIVYFFVFGLVFIFENLSLISTPNVLFWAQVTLYVSIVRLSLIFILTTYVFSYMKIDMRYAFIGAFIYGGSMIYFRHVTYWEFFADAFLWLPLFVLGIEKIFREKKQLTLIAAVALSMFDNFYFAYIHFVFMGIYILLRWLIPLANDEKLNLMQFTLSILLGAGISAVSFIPAAYGYVHNYRPPFDDYISWFDFKDNVLLMSRTYLLPAILVLFLCIKTFYGSKLFRLFASIAILIALSHYIPVIASAFNGFSAPQNRFEYLGYFAVGGAIAAGLMHLSKLSRETIKKASLYTFLIYSFFYVIDDPMRISKLVTLIVSLLLIGIYTILLKRKKTVVIMSTIIMANLVTLFVYNKNLLATGDVSDSTKKFITSVNYDSAEQRALIHRVLEHDDAPFTRLDWMAGNRNNTPMIYGFNGLSAYSSILNENISSFYYRDLEIDMKRESVSRYNSLGNRANLYSLLRGKYIMYKKGTKKNIPFGFSKYMESNNYVIYRNGNTLPFIRTTKNIYSEEAVNHVPIVDREHAMLNGVIVKDPSPSTVKPARSGDLMEHTNIIPVNGTFKNGQLEVEGDQGGIDIKLNRIPVNTKDLYLSFYLKNNDKDAPGFRLTVNDFKTSRKSRQSIYRTKVNNITVRVPKDDTLAIRVPQGTYTLKDFKLFSEDYHALKKEVNKENPEANVKIKNNHINITLQNKNNDLMMTLPIPYEKGWEAHVNGEKQKVQKVNYSFIGIPIQSGENNIKLIFYPPYFRLSILISGISLLLAFVWIRTNRKQRLSKKAS
ncbi:hypothetical protein D1B33_17835 [Lysinibacillus yapensis]|uniref:YfhO family protein n=1 Tax=Ureibacillus yapensis TaxID=2304605 RepID=A0A396SHR9_9BACL|nr:YfhO family protein [Lysinibacillus yapensis]RHW31372.1 hypothetical protein D1B33_17835 [Lysinibacillus yapensis]